MIDSGYNLKMEPIEFADGLGVRYTKKGLRMIPRFVFLCLFSRVIGRPLISFTVTQNTTERADLGGKLRI